MLMKKVSQAYDDNYLALVYQYIGMTIAALGIGAIRSLYHNTAYLPSMSLSHWGIAFAVSIIWYAGIALLFKAYDHVCGGVALVIANLATFFMYFINLALYPWQESFSLGKIILAVWFFIVIAFFLVDQDTCPIDPQHPENHKKLINPYMLYAIWTAICWSGFFVGNSWFIKSGVMSPVQSGMITESLILVVALMRYLWQHKWAAISRIQQWLAKKDRLSFLSIGVLNVLSVYLLYYGYQTNSANMINVIKLFTIPVAAIACWIFLKDYLSRKQIILLTLWFGLMVWFIFV